MAITLESFQSIQSTRGFVRMDEAGTGAKVYGDTRVLGKAAAFVKNPGPEANKQLRQDLFDAIAKEYGEPVANDLRDLIKPNSDRPLSTSKLKVILEKAEGGPSSDERIDVRDRAKERVHTALMEAAEGKSMDATNRLKSAYLAIKELHGGNIQKAQKEFKELIKSEMRNIPGDKGQAAMEALEVFDHPVASFAVKHMETGKFGPPSKEDVDVDKATVKGSLTTEDKNGLKETAKLLVDTLLKHASDEEGEEALVRLRQAHTALKHVNDEDTALAQQGLLELIESGMEHLSYNEKMDAIETLEHSVGQLREDDSLKIIAQQVVTTMKEAVREEDEQFKSLDVELQKIDELILHLDDPPKPEEFFKSGMGDSLGKVLTGIDKDGRDSTEVLNELHPPLKVDSPEVLKILDHINQLGQSDAPDHLKLGAAIEIAHLQKTYGGTPSSTVLEDFCLQVASTLDDFAGESYENGKLKPGGEGMLAQHLEDLNTNLMGMAGNMGKDLYEVMGHVDKLEII